MITISFEVKDKHDLLAQVHDFVGADKYKPEPAPQDIETKEQIKPSPVSVPTPAAPEQSSTVSQPAAIVPQPVAAQAVARDSAPLIEDEGLDVEGVPWDERIHAATKTKCKDGTWKKKKGVDFTEYTRIKEQLRAVVPECLKPAPPAVPTIPPIKQYISEIDAERKGEQPVPPPVVSTQQYNPIAIPDVTKPAHSFETFKNGFLGVMALLKTQGHLTPEYIATLKQHFQVNELWEVISDDSKVADLFNNFVSFGWITKVD